MLLSVLLMQYSAGWPVRLAIELAASHNYMQTHCMPEFPD